MHPSHWALAVAVAWLPCSALAAVPRIVGTPVVENPAFDGVDNTMMYTVAVTVSGAASDVDHRAVVGFVSDDQYTTCTGTTAWTWAHAQRFDTTVTRSWTLYNFQPGTGYHYKVTVGTGATARSRCGVLETTSAPTPTLPTNLANLNLTYEFGGVSHPSDAQYVLLETDDCGATGTTLSGARDYLVVLDPMHGTIVWYLDVVAATGIRGARATGFRYQPGPSSTSGRLLVTVQRQYLFEWAFDGTEVSFHDFGASDECSGVSGSEGPCPHHDAFKSDDTGNTYVLASTRTTMDATDTEWEANCGTSAYFVDDGFNVLNDLSEVVDEHYLMADYGYDPTVYGGPSARGAGARPTACHADTWNGAFDPSYGTIDWTHANSLAATKFGPVETVDLSLKEWSQIVRINTATGAQVWRLSAHTGDSDWTLAKAPGIAGAAKFSSQHDVHGIAANTLMMFDNHGDSAGARVIEIVLDDATGSATIEKSWALVDPSGSPVRCGKEGVGELVPDSADGHVLGLCTDQYLIAELDDPTGNSGNPPALAITLPDGRPDPFCASGGPDDRSTIAGWQRAFPLATVGEF